MPAQHKRPGRTARLERQRTAALREAEWEQSRITMKQNQISPIALSYERIGFSRASALKLALAQLDGWGAYIREELFISFN